MLDRRIFLLFLVIGGSWEWAYNGPYGPENWCNLPDQETYCCGNRQSPINIDTSTVVETSFQVLENGLENVWSYVNLTNERHTVSLHVPKDSSNNPSLAIWYDFDTISDTYLFDSLHFHFGSDDSVGSEHLINEQAFPMEMHTIFYNSKYPSFTDSKNYPDGVIVLGTQFYISAFDNANYQPLVNGLNGVIYVDQVATVKPGFSISQLLPDDLSFAYSYQGSLTTPACNEVVQWFVLGTRIGISESQMSKYRALTVLDQPQNKNIGNDIDSTADEYMSNNYRPVQALNGRTVYFNKGYF